MRANPRACLALLLLTGCAIGPDYITPKTSPPPSWAGMQELNQPAVVNEQSSDLARWWRQFRDPELTSLVEEALKGNLSVAVAEARLRQARAVRGIAVAGLWPTATATAGYQRQAGPQFNSVSTSRNMFQAGLDAAWELDVFGGVRRNIEAASASEQAATESMRDAQVSLAAEVALAYVRLRGFQQQIVTARNNLKVQQHTVDITRKLFGVGLNSSLDVANAESTVATTEAQIPVFESGARQAIYSLSVLLARPPGDLVTRLSPEGNLPAIPEQVPAGLPSDLIRRRPDVRQAEAQLHGATAQIGVAKAGLFPQFALTGGVNWQSPQANTWWTTSSTSLFIGPSMTWPIFQGGATVSNIHAQEAVRDQALLSYQQAILTALQDVENALIAFAKEQQHQKSLGDAVAADQKAVNLSLQLYAEGQTSFLNVLTAQRSLYADENALIQSKESIAADMVALFKALGGGCEAGSTC